MTGDRPIDGSSRMSIFGRDISALPMASICCSPPESDRAHCLRRSFSRGKWWNTSSRSLAISALSRAQEGAGAQILLDRQVGKYAAAFGHMRDAERHDLLRRKPVDALAGEDDLAPAEPHKARDRPQGGALAGAVGADDGDDAAVGHVHVDAFERGDLVVVDVDDL